MQSIITRRREEEGDRAAEGGGDIESFRIMRRRLLFAISLNRAVLYYCRNSAAFVYSQILAPLVDRHPLDQGEGGGELKPESRQCRFAARLRHLCGIKVRFQR